MTDTSSPASSTPHRSFSALSTSTFLRHRSHLLPSFLAFVSVIVSSAEAAAAMSTASKKSLGPIKNVAIAIAMEAEASPFVKHLGLTVDADFFPAAAPFKAFTGSHGDCQVTVVTSGKDGVYGTGADNIGTVSAGLMTFLTLQQLKAKDGTTGTDGGGGGGGGGADLLISAGTAGGFRAKGAAIGDVYLTTSVANHDRRIPLPPFDVYGIGKIDCSSLVSTMAAEMSSENAKVKTGVCTTGNSLDAHDWDSKHMAENGASVKDMEYASVAWACELNQVPHFGVKVVTDIVDGNRPADEEFLENLHTAAESLQEALPQVIEHVCGKTHDEL